VSKILIQISEVAKENRVSLKANSEICKELAYLGLEQIEEQTGTILPKAIGNEDGKSNTFQFDERHVLYGKLRPYLNKVACPEKSGRCSTELIPLLPIGISRDLLAMMLRSPRVVEAAMRENTGSRMPRANMKAVLCVKLLIPREKEEQKELENRLKAAFECFAITKNALLKQKADLDNLIYRIIADSITSNKTTVNSIGEILVEVKTGIGDDCKNLRVLGATRSGLALAKEPPGKNPQRYKPVTPGTVFYNPMRIMIGSIAFVDDDDEPGITSPDYVALKGKEGVVDSRWFYYWLRSPYGQRCIESLARGAVRERMLFNRLAEGTIELPDYDTQLKASKALAEIKPMQQAIEKQLQELELIPQKILAQVFEN
jgi:type I restriction enzyme S subunit